METATPFKPKKPCLCKTKPPERRCILFKNADAQKKLVKGDVCKCVNTCTTKVGITEGTKETRTSKPTFKCACKQKRSHIKETNVLNKGTKETGTSEQIFQCTCKKKRCHNKETDAFNNIDYVVESVKTRLSPTNSEDSLRLATESLIIDLHGKSIEHPSKEESGYDIEAKVDSVIRDLCKCMDVGECVIGTTIKEPEPEPEPDQPTEEAETLNKSEVFENISKSTLEGSKASNISYMNQTSTVYSVSVTDVQEDKGEPERNIIENMESKMPATDVQDSGFSTKSIEEPMVEHRIDLKTEISEVLIEKKNLEESPSDKLIPEIANKPSIITTIEQPKVEQTILEKDFHSSHEHETTAAVKTVNELETMDAKAIECINVCGSCNMLVESKPKVHNETTAALEAVEHITEAINKSVLLKSFKDQSTKTSFVQPPIALEAVELIAEDINTSLLPKSFKDQSTKTSFVQPPTALEAVEPIAEDINKSLLPKSFKDQSTKTSFVQPPSAEAILVKDLQSNQLPDALETVEHIAEDINKSLPQKSFKDQSTKTSFIQEAMEEINLVNDVQSNHQPETMATKLDIEATQQVGSVENIEEDNSNELTSECTKSQLTTSFQQYSTAESILVEDCQAKNDSETTADSISLNKVEREEPSKQSITLTNSNDREVFQSSEIEQDVTKCKDVCSGCSSFKKQESNHINEENEEFENAENCDTNLIGCIDVFLSCINFEDRESNIGSGTSGNTKKSETDFIRCIDVCSDCRNVEDRESNLSIRTTDVENKFKNPEANLVGCIDTCLSCVGFTDRTSNVASETTLNIENSDTNSIRCIHVCLSCISVEDLDSKSLSDATEEVNELQNAEANAVGCIDVWLSCIHSTESKSILPSETTLNIENPKTDSIGCFRVCLSCISVEARESNLSIGTTDAENQFKNPEANLVGCIDACLSCVRFTDRISNVASGTTLNIENSDTNSIRCIHVCLSCISVEDLDSKSLSDATEEVNDLKNAEANAVGCIDVWLSCIDSSESKSIVPSETTLNIENPETDSIGCLRVCLSCISVEDRDAKCLTGAMEEINDLKNNEANSVGCIDESLSCIHFNYHEANIASEITLNNPDANIIGCEDICLSCISDIYHESKLLIEAVTDERNDINNAEVNLVQCIDKCLSCIRCKDHEPSLESGATKELGDTANIEEISKSMPSSHENYNSTNDSCTCSNICSITVDKHASNSSAKLSAQIPLSPTKPSLEVALKAAQERIITIMTNELSSKVDTTVFNKIIHKIRQDDDEAVPDATIRRLVGKESEGTENIEVAFEVVNSSTIKETPAENKDVCICFDTCAGAFSLQSVSRNQESSTSCVKSTAQSVSNQLSPTKSSLELALKEAQERCIEKDRIIAIMTQELSKIDPTAFNVMIHEFRHSVEAVPDYSSQMLVGEEFEDTENTEETYVPRNAPSVREYTEGNKDLCICSDICAGPIDKTATISSLVPKTPTSSAISSSIKKQPDGNTDMCICSDICAGATIGKTKSSSSIPPKTPTSSIISAIKTEPDDNNDVSICSDIYSGPSDKVATSRSREPQVPFVKSTAQSISNQFSPTKSSLELAINAAQKRCVEKDRIITIMSQELSKKITTTIFNKIIHETRKGGGAIPDYNIRMLIGEEFENAKNIPKPPTQNFSNPLRPTKSLLEQNLKTAQERCVEKDRIITIMTQELSNKIDITAFNKIIYETRYGEEALPDYSIRMLVGEEFEDAKNIKETTIKKETDYIKNTCICSDICAGPVDKTVSSGSLGLKTLSVKTPVQDSPNQLSPTKSSLELAIKAAQDRCTEMDRIITIMTQELSNEVDITLFNQIICKIRQCEQDVPDCHIRMLNTIQDESNDITDVRICCDICVEPIDKPASNSYQEPETPTSSTMPNTIKKEPSSNNEVCICSDTCAGPIDKTATSSKRESIPLTQTRSSAIIEKQNGNTDRCICSDTCAGPINKIASGSSRGPKLPTSPTTPFSIKEEPDGNSDGCICSETCAGQNNKTSTGSSPRADLPTPPTVSSSIKEKLVGNMDECICSDRFTEPVAKTASASSRETKTPTLPTMSSSIIKEPNGNKDVCGCANMCARTIERTASIQSRETKTQQCACVKPSVQYFSNQLNPTKSLLELAVKAAQDRCEEKDRILTIMTQELSNKASTSDFKNILHKITQGEMAVPDYSIRMLEEESNKNLCVCQTSDNNAAGSVCSITPNQLKITKLQRLTNTILFIQWTTANISGAIAFEIYLNGTFVNLVENDKDYAIIFTDKETVEDEVSIYVLVKEGRCYPEAVAITS